MPFEHDKVSRWKARAAEYAKAARAAGDESLGKGASLLGKLNAAHASQAAFDHASPKSVVGALALYKKTTLAANADIATYADLNSVTQSKLTLDAKAVIHVSELDRSTNGRFRDRYRQGPTATLLRKADDLVIDRVWVGCRQSAYSGDRRLADVGSDLRAMTAPDNKADISFAIYFVTCRRGSTSCSARPAGNESVNTSGVGDLCAANGRLIGKAPVLSRWHCEQVGIARFAVADLCAPNDFHRM